MSVSHQRSLPGINPGFKNFQSFTNTVVDGTVAVTIGPLVGAAIATDEPLSVLQHGMLTSNPTADRAWTLPLATTILSNLTQFTNVDVGDGFEFIIRNIAAGGSGFDITLTVAAGILADADSSLVVPPQGFSKFILRCDDPTNTVALAAFTIFQVDSGTINVGVAQVASLVAAGANATNGATTLGATPLFELVGGAMTGLTFVVDPDEAGVLSGMTIATTNARNSTQVTFTETGLYLVTLTISVEVSTLASALIATLEFAIGLGANIPTTALSQSIIFAGTADGVELSTVTGSIIVPIDAVATDVLNVYIRGGTNVVDTDIFTPQLVRVVIHKLSS